MNVMAKYVSPEDLEQLDFEYFRALGNLKDAVEYIRKENDRSWVKHYNKSISNVFAKLINRGVTLSYAVLGSKKIPAGWEKKLELSIRVLMSAKKTPTDTVAWYDKNLANLHFLHNAATTWVEKSEDDAEDNEKFQIGPFIVHNTIGLTGDDLEGIKNALSKASVLIKASNVPDISKVLYGDVMVVGKLQKANVVAFYSIKEDTVFVRPFKNAGSDELFNTIHELGHRYIERFIDKSVWLQWRRYHARVAWQHGDIPVIPGVGESLPFKIKGVKGDPVVVRIEENRYYFSDSGYMNKSRIMEIMTRDAAYPTPYSAVSPDEHFCDALALKAMGKLKEPHLSAFKTIIEDGQEYGIVKLAHLFTLIKQNRGLAASTTEDWGKQAMASTYTQISRDDLEDWLGDLPLYHKWSLKQGKAGVYLLPLSTTVAVKMSSTIGTSDDAMGRGQASMQLALVSLVTGQVINKKAQGQSHFARTTNWRKNWKDGFGRMKDAYTKAQGFYDALAAIEDRDRYKSETIKKIEFINGWRDDSMLSDLHSRVTQGGILTNKQLDMVDRLTNQSLVLKEDPMIQVLRDLYRAAKSTGNQWLMDFTKSVADQLKQGRSLSPKQIDVINNSRTKFKVANRATAS